MDCEPTELTMTRFTFLVMVAMVIGVMAPTVGRTQGPAPSASPSSSAPVTGMKPDRTTADPSTRQRMRQKEAELKLKRAACRKEARENHVSLLKRRSFVRDCMSR